MRQAVGRTSANPATTRQFIVYERMHIQVITIDIAQDLDMKRELVSF